MTAEKILNFHSIKKYNDFVKKYRFNLICSHRDKKCKYRRIERYVSYCAGYKRKIECDNEADKKNIDKREMIL